MSDGPSGAIVWANDEQQIFFLDAATGAVLGTQSLLFGQLSVPPVVRNLEVYCAEGLTLGTSVIHRFSLADPANITDWPTPPTVAGSIDAPVVLEGNILYVASNTGFIDVFDVGGPVPVALKQIDVLKLGGSAAVKVNGLFLSADGAQLFLTSAKGVYAVTIAAPTPFVAWSGSTNVDFTAVSPVLDGWWLVAANGTSLYAFDTNDAPASATMTPKWTSDLSSTISRIWVLGPQMLLAGDSRNTLTFVDEVSGESAASVGLPALVTTAQLTFADNLLVSLSTSGTFAANQLNPLSLGGPTITNLWSSVTATAFSGPPLFIGTTAYGIGADQKLYAFDIGTKTQLFSEPVAGTISTSFFAPGFVPRYLQNATGKVQFLLDGRDFFITLRNLFIAAGNQSLDPPTQLPSSLTFLDLVRGVANGANGGANVFVMMWDSSILAGLGYKFRMLATVAARKYAELFNVDGTVAGDQRHNGKAFLALQAIGPNVKPFLDMYRLAQSNYNRYAAWFFGPEVASVHQKIAVFSINGARFALVGGLNLDTPAYFDTKEHPLQNGGGFVAGWHDTAVLLQGDVVKQVEAEFDRRWLKKGSPATPSTNTYVKFASWDVIHGSCLDFEGVCGAGGTPQPYTDPTLSTATVPLQTLITSNDAPQPTAAQPAAWLPPTTQIRGRLIELIGAATRYAYFENFTFSDTELIGALAQKLSSTPAFLLIVVISHPHENENTENAIMYYYTRISYAILKLASSDWQNFTAGTTTYESSSATFVSANIDSLAYQDSTITISTDGTLVDVPVTSISAITDKTGITPQVNVCGPARFFSTPPSWSNAELADYPANFRRVYVHSKLALFDDAVALVGSANFSLRSMANDGEMSVLIDDGSTVLGLRTALFHHWNMTTADAWPAAMKAFAETTSDGLGILPLPYAHVPDTLPYWSWSMLNTLFDPALLFL